MTTHSTENTAGPDDKPEPNAEPDAGTAIFVVLVLPHVLALLAIVVHLIWAW